MQGVEFVVDEKGDRKAVLIDLKKWASVWEDIYDILVSESRKAEPRAAWDEVRRAPAKSAERRPRVSRRSR